MKPGSVLDSSALLAWMFDENGKSVVSKAFETGCVISAVNWSEVVQKAVDRGISIDMLYGRLKAENILHVVLTIEGYEEQLATKAGGVYPMTKAAGLSLGDRACLCLAIAKQVPVFTTDTAWPKVSDALDVDVRLIR